MRPKYKKKLTYLSIARKSGIMPNKKTECPFFSNPFGRMAKKK